MAEMENAGIDMRHLVEIDVTEYPLYNGDDSENYFGYVFEDIDSSWVQAGKSLAVALRFDRCVDEEHSLDLVFRSALREMVSEIHAFDSEPGFISARYLELTLLQKIRRYYMDLWKKDVIECLLPSCLVPGLNAKTCDLMELVRGNGCENYLRRLIGLYNITSASELDRITDSKSVTPQDMRVWTTVRAQMEVNGQIKAHMQAVLEETVATWKGMDAAAKIETPIRFVFVRQHRKTIRPFMTSHHGFLAAVLRASELFAWTCFGVTTNDIELGTAVMAHSFMQGRKEKINKIQLKTMVWNFPLTAIYPQEQPSLTGQKSQNCGTSNQPI